MSKVSFDPKEIKKYVFDPSISIKDRAFVLFSVLVLLALFAAVPCGLIMREPPIATISTLVGAVCFSAYVFFAFKTNRIARAKIALSIVVVVIFLPAMFFTNGGVLGGTPIWLLLGTIYIALILDGKWKLVMSVVNAVILTACWIIGYLFPDLVTEYSRGGNYFDSIAALFIVGSIVYTIITFQTTLVRREEANKNLKRLFEQTAMALVSAIDAKDEYTHGHSARVAEYSRKIAEYSGKSPEECDEIYYAALLHDVGKIGVAEEIINKPGKLTEAEYDAIKQHPVLGSQILKSITEYPNLLVGARFHHERYDGKGYPEHLKGEDIPEIARIISVADAYDAMTSKRSYRDPIPQQSVREEIVKGVGTQFDPKFAKIMQHLIDLDSEYDMREKDNVKELSGKNEMTCIKVRDEVSEGIPVNPEIKKIRFKCEVVSRADGPINPAIILFDSLDGRYHDNPREMKSLNYFEYAVLWLDGRFEMTGARKIEVSESKSSVTESVPSGNGSKVFDIEAVKVKDHVQIKIDDSETVVTFIIALPDNSRFAYIGLSGENTHLYAVNINTIEGNVPKDYIPRIAEEVSYIKVPDGDIPNIQVDGYRTADTLGIPVRDGMQLKFHAMSLPTARLVWHCAYLDIFYSPDKHPSGKGYREYALIRLDGENWEAQEVATNKLIVSVEDEFEGWDGWREGNKKGYDCTVSFKREGNIIVTTTENLGISIKNTTTVLDDPPEVFVSLTGDQVAITDIRIIGGDAAV